MSRKMRRRNGWRLQRRNAVQERSCSKALASADTGCLNFQGIRPEPHPWGNQQPNRDATTMPRILYLHGLSGSPNGQRAMRLRFRYGAKSIRAPELPFSKNSFRRVSLCSAADALRILSKAEVIARAATEGFQPDVVVGTSLGGAVAMQVAGSRPLLLIAPVWNRDVKATGLCRVVSGDSFWASVSAPSAKILLHAFGGLLFPALPESIGPSCIVLHSRTDELFDLEHSRRLLREQVVPLSHCLGIRKTMKPILGNFNSRSANRKSGRPYEVDDSDERLVVVGDGHRMCDEAALQCTEAAIRLLLSLGDSRQDSGRIFTG